MVPDISLGYAGAARVSEAIGWPRPSRSRSSATQAIIPVRLLPEQEAPHLSELPDTFSLTNSGVLGWRLLALPGTADDITADTALQAGSALQLRRFRH